MSQLLTMEDTNDDQLKNSPLSPTSSPPSTPPKNGDSPNCTNHETPRGPAWLSRCGNALRTYGRVSKAKEKPSSEALSQKNPPSIPEKRQREVEEPLTPAKRPRLSSVCHPVPSGPTKIFVRVRPPPKDAKLRKDHQRYHVIGPAIYIDLSDVEQDMSTNVDVVGKKFYFSGAFQGDDTQTKVFERVVEPQLMEFFEGTDCALMAYGTTDSGKSHTVTGAPSDPGLIPKTLEYIFCLEKPNQIPNYKPRDNVISSLNFIQRFEELDIRREFLSSPCQEEMDLYSDKVQAPQKGCEVWVSLAEIANEAYFDLLSPSYLQSHSPLSLGTDFKGTRYIQGLTHLSVGSPPEALDILAVGQDNLHKWASMNTTTASKSHSIFTITLLKYPRWDDAESVQMSRFSFCDLAAHVLPRLDRSLLAILRCLQSSKDRQPPNAEECFSPSSLTSLFSDALTRKNPLSFVITVDPSPKVYRETHSVLHATSVSSEIATKIRSSYPSSEATTTFGRIAEIPQKIVDWEELTAEKLVELSEHFTNEIDELRVLNLRSDVQTRQRNVQRYFLMLKRIENSYKRKPEAESHSEDIEGLKAISQKLRSQKQLLERELAVCQGKLGDCPTESGEGWKNPHLILLDDVLAERDARARNDNLIKILNEARGEYLRVTESTRETWRKIGEIERKTLALRLDRDSEHTHQMIINDASNEELEVVASLEETLQGKKEQCRRYLEEVYEKFGEAGAGPGDAAAGDAVEEEESMEKPRETSAEVTIPAGEGESSGGTPEIALPASTIESQNDSEGVEVMENDGDQVVPTSETQIGGESLTKEVVNSFGDEGSGASEEEGLSPTEASVALKIPESGLVDNSGIAESDVQLPVDQTQVANFSETPENSEASSIGEDSSDGSSEHQIIGRNCLEEIQNDMEIRENQANYSSVDESSSVSEASTVVSVRQLETLDPETIDSFDTATRQGAFSLKSKLPPELDALPVLVASMSLIDHDYSISLSEPAQTSPEPRLMSFKGRIRSPKPDDALEWQDNEASAEKNSHCVNEELKDDLKSQESQQTSPSMLEDQSSLSPLGCGIVYPEELESTISEIANASLEPPLALSEVEISMALDMSDISPPDGYEASEVAEKTSDNQEIQRTSPSTSGGHSSVDGPASGPQDEPRDVTSEDRSLQAPPDAQHAQLEDPPALVEDVEELSNGLELVEKEVPLEPSKEESTDCERVEDVQVRAPVNPENEKTKRSTRKRSGPPLIPLSLKHSKQSSSTGSTRRRTRRPASPRIPPVRENLEAGKCDECGETITAKHQFHSKQCGKCSLDTLESTAIRSTRRSSRCPGTAGITSEDSNPVVLFVTCDRCSQRITDEYRFHCKICRDGDFDLCRICYSEVRHEHNVEVLLTTPEDLLR